MSPFNPNINRSLGCAIMVILCSSLPSALAQSPEITWRFDYAKARQEAIDKVRPLFIDFGTENCFWCKRLDASTFRDPDLIQFINNRCIPLKVDANINPQLAEALRIQNYPTLVFASSDGRILGMQEGFLEAPALKDKLQKVLATVSDPEWMVRDYEEALKARDGSDHTRAVALLKTIVMDGKDRPVQQKASKLLEELEQLAAQRLKQSEELMALGQRPQAIEKITEMVERYSGTHAARMGSNMLVNLTGKREIVDVFRIKRARDLLAQAHEDYRTKQFLCCLDRCDVLATNFADLPEAAEANRLAMDIKNNPEWTKQACDQMGDRLSMLYLSLADTSMKKGQPQQAVFYLERIVQTFPNSKHADVAQMRLALLQARPLPPLPSTSSVVDEKPR